MRGCAILEKSPNKAFFLRRTVSLRAPSDREPGVLKLLAADVA